MIPAFTSSSLYLPISVSISWLGITPASLSLLAFTRTITRMSSTPCFFVPLPTRRTGGRGIDSSGYAFSGGHPVYHRALDSTAGRAHRDADGRRRHAARRRSLHSTLGPSSAVQYRYPAGRPGRIRHRLPAPAGARRTPRRAPGPTVAQHAVARAGIPQLRRLRRDARVSRGSRGTGASGDRPDHGDHVRRGRVVALSSSARDRLHADAWMGSDPRDDARQAGARVAHRRRHAATGRHDRVPREDAAPQPALLIEPAVTQRLLSRTRSKIPPDLLISCQPCGRPFRSLQRYRPRDRVDLTM